MDTSAGILDVALYFPKIVRSNDWWPSDVVARWKDHKRTPLPVSSISSGAARVLEALFMMQLTLAELMIAPGRARIALLVQPCSASRFIDMEDSISPLFGEGATAVILMRWGR